MSEYQTEVQRLRAVLERIRKIAKESREAKYYVDNHLLIETIVEQALSATTDTGAKRVMKLWRNPMAAGAYRAGIRDTLDALGVSIPGINAPEGDGNDA